MQALPPQPGIGLQFHLGDALYSPELQRRLVRARCHAADGTLNSQLLAVAVAYLRLLEAEQAVQIMDAMKQLTGDLAKLTRDFAETGQGLQADADRLSTELQLVESRRLAAVQQAEVARANLVRALSWDGAERIVPTDPSVVPFELLEPDTPVEDLLATGLANRPELKEAQSLVSAAVVAYRREKTAPFIPSVLLGFSTGGFGGGLGSSVDNTDYRYDLDAAVAWQVRNLGLGEQAAVRQAHARLQQARFEVVDRMDEITRQISAAHARVMLAGPRIAATEQAVAAAHSSYELNLQRIRDGHGLPLEVLQSLQALEAAQRAYLQAVIEQNIAQFELQHALGWPIRYVDTH